MVVASRHVAPFKYILKSRSDEAERLVLEAAQEAQLF
jgi:hypothetical protein